MFIQIITIVTFWQKIFSISLLLTFFQNNLKTYKLLIYTRCCFCFRLLLWLLTCSVRSDNECKKKTTLLYSSRNTMHAQNKMYMLFYFYFSFSVKLTKKLHVEIRLLLKSNTLLTKFRSDLIKTWTSSGKLSGQYWAFWKTF